MLAGLSWISAKHQAGPGLANPPAHTPLPTHVSGVLGAESRSNSMTPRADSPTLELNDTVTQLEGKIAQLEREKKELAVALQRANKELKKVKETDRERKDLAQALKDMEAREAMWHVERALVRDKEREIKHLADALKEMEEREEKWRVERQFIADARKKEGSMFVRTC